MFKLDLSSNLDEFLQQLDGQVANLPEVIKEATSAATWRLFSYSRRLLKDLVYNKAIPRLKNGTPAWRRTYNLLNAERVSMRSTGVDTVEGIIDTDESSPAIEYAAPRHNLSHGNSRSGTPARIARWREKAVEQGTPAASTDFRDTFYSRLNKR